MTSCITIGNKHSDHCLTFWQAVFLDGQNLQNLYIYNWLFSLSEKLDSKYLDTFILMQIDISGIF